MKHWNRFWNIAATLYINCSQTHGCENWDWGRAILRKGINICEFRCNVGQIGSQGIHMQGVLPWLVSWAICASTREDCHALTAPVSPVQIFLPHQYTISNYLTPSTQQAGQAVVTRRLSLCWTLTLSQTMHKDQLSFHLKYGRNLNWMSISSKIYLEAWQNGYFIL